MLKSTESSYFSDSFILAGHFVVDREFIYIKKWSRPSLQFWVQTHLKRLIRWNHEVSPKESFWLGVGVEIRVFVWMQYFVNLTKRPTKTRNMVENDTNHGEHENAFFHQEWSATSFSKALQRLSSDRNKIDDWFGCRASSFHFEERIENPICKFFAILC